MTLTVKRQRDNGEGNKYATTMRWFDREVRGRGKRELCGRRGMIHTTIAERGEGLSVQCGEKCRRLKNDL